MFVKIVSVFIISLCFLSTWLLAKQEIPNGLVINSKVNSSRANFLVKAMIFSDEAAATDFIKRRKSVILKQLEPKFDPYTGSSALPEDCQLKNLPSPKSEKALTMLSFYSSANRVLAMCDIKKNRLKTQYLMTYCPPAKKLFIVKYFYSDKLEWLQEPVASCEK